MPKLHDDVFITHKGKNYTDADLDEIYYKLSENYTPKRDNNEDKRFDPKENLSNEQKQEIELWRTKMKASAWKSRQRSLRRNGKLEQYKIDALNKLGMLWSPREDEWEKKYLLFKKYGLCDEIEKWVRSQRELWKSGKLSKENLVRLEFISFPFEPKLNEEFPFTFNSLYELKEKLRKKKRRLELKLIKNPPKKLAKKQKEVIHREKFQKENKEKNKKYNSFYSKWHLINSRVESNLLNLEPKEIQKIIEKIKSGENVYYQAKKEFLEKTLANKELGYFTKSYLKPFFDDLKAISGVQGRTLFQQQFNQISIFNSNKIDNKTRAYVCNILLDYLEYITTSKIKKFAPLDFLISCYKKEKNKEKLIFLKNYIDKYPLLGALYSDKINEVLIRL